MVDTNVSFTGAIPQYYDSCLGPAWFDAFAVDLAQRLPANAPGNVLEIACGTGLLTRHLREWLAPTLRLVATDLSPAMLDYGRRKLGDAKGIEWREVDACKLPFGDGEFGAVVCGFGFMFVPDKNAAFSEAHRVLKKGGILLFNVWCSLDENPHAKAGAEVVEGLFPGDPEMRFRTPYEMGEAALLRDFLDKARFRDAKIEKKRYRLDRVSARTIATGAIRGTPRSLMIQKRGIPLDDVIEKLTGALTKIGGADPYRGFAQIVVVEARRP
jgi:SAM-dependent methyltransferase